MNAFESSDELIELIASGDRVAAILVCYQANGGELENAWEEVKRLSLELGESGEMLPKSAAVDQNVKVLRAYLASGFWNRRKDQLQVGTVAIVLLVFVAYLVSIHLPPLIVDLRSLSWPEAEAEIVKVLTYSKSRRVQQRTVSTDYMDYSFRYEVDGEKFTGGHSGVPYFEVFGGAAFSVGDPITISYNPASPGQSISQRAIYKRSIRLFLAAGVLVFALLAAWYVWSRERTFRRLRQIDASLLQEDG